MKKILALSILMFLSCTKDEWDNRNPYLPEIAINLPINTNLPTYNKLNYAGNTVYIPGYGINGIIVINTGTGIRAFDATCANHAVSSCSKLLLNGVEATCGCEDKLSYNLFLGLPTTDAQFGLKEYRVSFSGNLINVYN